MSASPELQLRVGQKREAAETIKAALTLEPYRTALYVLRQDIDRALGLSDSEVKLRLVAGFRASANSYASTARDALAIRQYVRALRTAVEVPISDDARFEVEATVRRLTGFLVLRYSETHARAFWQSLAASSIMKDYKTRAEEEARRLGQQR